MPYTVQLARPPAGFAVSAALPGAHLLIEVCGFHTQDEGLAFTRMLEGCDIYLTGGPVTDPTQINHLLAIIAPDGKTTVYVNELPVIAQTQVKANKQAGDPVTNDDIADIIEIDLGVTVPPDVGILYLFSCRWRRALFFDFRPIGSDREHREYSLSAALAVCYCRLAFSEKFTLSDHQWEFLIDQRYFPFVGLKDATVSAMVNYCQQGWDLSSLLPRLVDDWNEISTDFAESCKGSDIFRPHADAIAIATRHLKNSDWFSAASVLYPSIEGILRTYYLGLGATTSPNQKNLLSAALNGSMVGRHGYCLLLLDKFDQYLKNVIFAPFDHKNPTGVSRHTIAHGVVNPTQCDEKSVVLAMLSLHHLFYSLKSPKVKP